MSTRIVVGENGPYTVSGLKVVRERIINDDTGHSDHPEIYAEVHDGGDDTWLCRCGHSENKPFCDGSHKRVGFDGTEAAPTDSYDDRAEILGGTGVEVRDDRKICSHAGYCTTRGDNVWKQVGNSADDTIRQDMLRRIDRCPSGALTHRAGPNAPDDENDLPEQVAVQADGPLVVTGRVNIERADGQAFETRNRVTLCRCGASKTKPLCDGSHSDAGFADS